MCLRLFFRFYVVFLSQDYDPYEENPGTGPFSEPETQIMRKVAMSFDPHIWVNIHSGMEVGQTKFQLIFPTVDSEDIFTFSGSF